ncbi:MAG: RecX family transcriptional regulator [candidate division Zixibacteria bacterium]|nr:RecX family transcriptional regulator [candidate division Zixibacteria bacterium]
MTIKITKITASGFGYVVEISTLTEPLRLSPGIYNKHRLKSGIVLTEPQLRQLTQEAERDNCDREVARLLGMRAHSEGELITKLIRKQFARSTVNEVVAVYVARGLVDDAQYAFELARQTLERRPAGRAYLLAVLKRKQIDSAIAETALDTLLHGRDEVDTAVAALEKRWLRFSEFDLETSRRKAYTYLSRRGISYSAAKAAFETLLNRTNEVCED